MRPIVKVFFLELVSYISRLKRIERSLLEMLSWFIAVRSFWINGEPFPLSIHEMFDSTD